jgi:hypothetical protein
VLARDEHSRPVPLPLEEVGEERRPVGLDRVEESLGARRHIGVGVDLAVGVPERHADLLPAILEREDLLDAGQRRQRGRALRPRLDHRAGARDREGAEGALVLWAEAHDLAPADRRASAFEPDAAELGESGGARGIRDVGRELGPERRRTILEHGHVVRARDL